MRGLPFMLLPVLLAVLPAVSQTRVLVTVDHTILRYQNADSIDVAGEVAAGQELTSMGPLEGVWVPVVPPEGISFWIYAELVRDGAIAADKAQIRSGAGLSCKVVASAERGTPVTSCGRLGDWLKIKPPPGLAVWVSRAALVPVPANTSPDVIMLPPAVASGLLAALNTTNAAATTDVAAVAATATNVPPPRPLPPPELAGLTLTSEAAQGRHIRFDGLLRRAAPGATCTPAAYRLSGPDKSGGVVTFCHVLGADSLFAPHVGTRVAVSGSVWWLKEEAVPVILVDQLTAAPPAIQQVKP